MGNIETALRLLSIKGMGCRSILKLKSILPDINQIFNIPLDQLKNTPGMDKRAVNLIAKGFNEKYVFDNMDILTRSPFKITTIFDDDYPARLKTIYDPPIVLYHNGNFIEEDTDAIAIVGSRNCTEYGRKVTEQITKGLVERNITIVSGFARGIDTEAHKAAIKYGGRTIAVLGNGVDIVYPSENRILKNEILKNGVYCSEFPFGSKPDATNFPLRNRIISGLTIGTIVIEAGKKSGAILTAYIALDQNRDVFAVPGRIFDKQSGGTNLIIQKGAKLVTNADDILNEIDNARKFSTTKKQLEINFQFSREEREVFDAIDNSIHIDKLAEKLEKSTPEILTILLSLELMGAIRQFPGKMFSKMD